MTGQQKYEFETFGFLLLKDFIPSEEMRLYVDAFDETMTRAPNLLAGQPAEINRSVIPFYRHNPAVYHRLLDHDKISEVVEDLLGEGFIFLVAEGHHRRRGTAWHHDQVGPEGMTQLKVDLFLDPVRADTGCLRMLPGSHFPELRDRMERWYGTTGLGDLVEWPAAIAMESDPGDAVVFNTNVYHAAIGEDHDRRSINIDYIQKPSKPEHEEYLKEIFPDDNPYYTPELFEDATPKRMRMLSYVKEAVYDVG